MPLLNRMNRLQEIFRIRIGPGAAILPKDVTRIHLFYAKKINKGHFGPRHFWREHLPRLKYHNPQVSITVEQSDNQEAEPTMTVYFSPEQIAESTTASNVESTSSPGRTETLELRHKKDSEIYQKLLEVTKAQEVIPTEEEKAQLKRYEQEAIDKAIDSREKKAVMMRLKEEARIERQMKEAARASGN